MFDETGSEAVQSPEEIIAKCRESLLHLIDQSGLAQAVEAAGQFGEVVDNQNWDQRVETEIKKLESSGQQVRAEIYFKLVEALYFVDQNRSDRCLESLESASDNAYDQSQIEGFEDLEVLSDKIDGIISLLKQIPAIA